MSFILRASGAGGFGPNRPSRNTRDTRAKSVEKGNPPTGQAGGYATPSGPASASFPSWALPVLATGVMADMYGYQRCRKDFQDEIAPIKSGNACPKTEFQWPLSEIFD